MLKYGLEQTEAAEAIEGAVQRALAEEPTRDLGGDRGTEAFTEAVIKTLPDRVLG
jgi:3-isopropylmalate dehydrogenase